MLSNPLHIIQHAKQYSSIILLLLVVVFAQAQPVANFTANKTSGCSPLTVQYTSTSTGNPTAYDWNLGNSNSSTLQNPSATYVVPGTYTVSLKVTNAAGNNTKTQTAYITVYANPVANFSGTPVSGCAPLPVTFSDASTIGNGALNQWTWDFGNGNTSRLQNPTNTYAGIGTFNVTLSVRDANGCENSITKNNYISTSAPFVADFTATGNTNCAVPATVNFSSSVSPAATYTYLWRFGDNTTSTQANPSKTYSTSGSYTVELDITAANGCKQTISKTQFVQVGGLDANFTFTTTNDCAPTNIFITNTTLPSASGLSYEWTLNGGQLKTSQNPNYQLTDKLSLISLLVQNSAGCRDTISKLVTLQDPPTADFTVSNDYFCQAPATVSFTNKSTGGATTFSWNFGNTLGGSGTNPTTNYSKKGTYNVRLVATRPSGCRDTMFKQIIVDSPSVIIDEQNRKGGCAPYNALFKVTDMSNDPLIVWEWKLNNNVVSTSKDFTYNLPNIGVYVFKLTASNSKGCVVTTYDTVRVSPLPVFDISANPQTICFNPGLSTLIFLPLDTNKASSIVWRIINPKSIVSSDGDTVNVKLTDTGYYTVQVIASNYGCTNILTKSNFLRVNPAIALFEFTIDDCSTDTVRFTSESVGKNRLRWDFDDNGASSTSNPNAIHVYSNAGSYDVKLVATDTTTGCSDSIVKPVVIILPPQVLFSPTDTAVCLGSTVAFTDKTTIDPSRTIKQWGYKLSDGRVSTAQNPAFQFNTAGTFGLMLTIKDNKNCFYTFNDSMTVKVYGGKAGFTLSNNAGCLPLNILVNDTSLVENPIVSRTWKWGTGDSLVSANAFGSYSYATAATNQETGTTLTLTVTDSKGCKFSTGKSIKPYQPKAQFGYATLKRCGVDSITLTSVINPQNVNTPATFKWWLPSGVSTSANTKFSASGDTLIPIKFELKDSLGCIDSVTQMIPIKAKKPVLGFDGFPRNISCFTDKPTVRLKDTSILGGGPIISRTWSFGNGNTATIPGKGNDTASLIYLKPGKYTVSLKIIDSVGCVDSLIAPDFVVAGGPMGTYSFTPNRGCMPLDVGFTVSSPNAALYFWDHADGNVDSFSVDTHTYRYTAPRVYYPRLTLVDSSLSCFNGLDAIDSIEVLPLPKPDFRSSQFVICKNGYITLNNTTPPHPSPINNWRWIIGDTDTLRIKQPGPIQFKYAGIFDIVLEATDTNGCFATMIKDTLITVNEDTIPPATPLVKRATVIDNENVLFEFISNTEPDFEKYIIYSSTNQYTINQILDSSLVEQNLNTLLNPYSYKLVAIDVCRNTSPESETHTTVELKATGLANSIALQWTPYVGFDTSKYYQIWRKTPETDFAPLDSVTGNTLSYTDTSVLCKQVYYYRIQTIETDSMLQTSWSDTAGAIPVYLNILPTPENIRATVVNNKSVLLEWHLAKHNRLFTYHIYKSEDDGEPALFKVVNASDTSLTDTEVNVQEHSYSYTTYVVDACGGKSAPSNISKTILLKVRMVGNDILKHDPELTWNAYEKWSPGVDHYIVDFWNEGSGMIDEVSRTDDATLHAKHKYINLTQPEYCYIVTAFKSGDTTLISESNQACVSTAPRLYAPNVFTVNNDKLNDLFFVRGIFVETFSLQIYNRWGELVFETNDMNQGWDGTFKGEPCKPDVFVYMAEGRGMKGERVTLTGNVTLLR